MNCKIVQRKIWLTGSRGFIGSHLVSELEHNHGIKRISNTKHNRKFSTCNNDQPIYVNFQNENSISKAIEMLGLPDVFVHLGWGDMTNPHSEMHLGANVDQSKNLIKILYKAGLDKFVFLGSMNEYGDRVGSLYEEMGSMGEITNYAKGKIEVAKFGFEKAKEMNRKFIHVRLFYTYGPVQKEGTLIQDLYTSYKKNTDVSLGLCEHYRDYIHVSDVVKGIRLLCNVEESNTVNLGSGKSIQLKEFVSLFWKILGGNPEKLHFGVKPPKKEQPQPYCFANLDKLIKLTGWKPSISLEEGIRMTVQELEKHSIN
jgi:UDP-glucose 4-epimerase